MKIHGTVAPGFESVKALYTQQMTRLAERNTQLCIYVGDECVVDLWASAIDDEQWNGDSLTNVFSSGKSLESILLAMLADRGLLDFNKRVTDYWPEYGKNGKAAFTVADIMRHEGGLAAFDTSLKLADFTTNNIKQNSMGEIIAAQTPRFRNGEENRRSYHGLTRGWIANEIFRRIEPNGRTMGEFLQAEVNAPLGTDIFIAMSEEEFKQRVTEVKMLGSFFQLRQSFLPRRFRRTDFNFFQLIYRLLKMAPVLLASDTRGTPPPVENAPMLEMFINPKFSRCETPSAAAKASARGLAKLAAVMADGGSLGEQTLMKADAWNALHHDATWRNMVGTHLAFTQGGLAEYNNHPSHTGTLDRGMNEGREGFYGWMGFGGSLFQWHPEYRIGFGYVPTSLNSHDLTNARGKVYQTEVMRCVEKLAANK